jgi:hypothetical protein
MSNPNTDTRPTLKSVQRRFESWRNRRTKREPIPEPLWGAAATLCRRYSISHVCRQLHLSFTELKKHVSTSKSAPVQFVDLEPGCFSGPWHMECERPDGSTLRFSGNGQVPPIEHLLVRFLS